MQELAGVIGVGLNAAAPVRSAGIDRGVEDVREVIGNRGEVAV